MAIGCGGNDSSVTGWPTRPPDPPGAGLPGQPQGMGNGGSAGLDGGAGWGSGASSGGVPQGNGWNDGGWAPADDGGGTGDGASAGPVVGTGGDDGGGGPVVPDSGGPPLITPDAGGAPVDAGAPAGSVTFTALYATVLAGCAGCHTNAGPAGNLDLSTQGAAHANLVGVVAAGAACAGKNETRVVPGSAGTSLLYKKANGTQDCGASMAPGNAADVDLIKRWIDDGAKND